MYYLSNIHDEMEKLWQTQVLQQMEQRELRQNSNIEALLGAQNLPLRWSDHQKDGMEDKGESKH